MIGGGAKYHMVRPQQGEECKREMCPIPQGTQSCKFSINWDWHTDHLSYKVCLQRCIRVDIKCFHNANYNIGRARTPCQNIGLGHGTLFLLYEHTHTHPSHMRSHIPLFTYRLSWLQFQEHALYQNPTSSLLKLVLPILILLMHAIHLLITGVNSWQVTTKCFISTTRSDSEGHNSLW